MPYLINSKMLAEMKDLGENGNIKDVDGKTIKNNNGIIYVNEISWTQVTGLSSEFVSYTVFGEFNKFVNDNFLNKNEILDQNVEGLVNFNGGITVKGVTVDLSSYLTIQQALLEFGRLGAQATNSWNSQNNFNNNARFYKSVSIYGSTGGNLFLDKDATGRMLKTPDGTDITSLVNVDYINTNREKIAYDTYTKSANYTQGDLTFFIEPDNKNIWAEINNNHTNIVSDQGYAYFTNDPTGSGTGNTICNRWTLTSHNSKTIWKKLFDNPEKYFLEIQISKIGGSFFEMIISEDLKPSQPNNYVMNYVGGSGTQGAVGSIYLYGGTQEAKFSVLNGTLQGSITGQYSNGGVNYQFEELSSNISFNWDTNTMDWFINGFAKNGNDGSWKSVQVLPNAASETTTAKVINFRWILWERAKVLV